MVPLVFKTSLGIVRSPEGSTPSLLRQRSADPFLIFPSYYSETGLSGAVADISDLDQIFRDDPVNDPVAIPGGQEGSVALKGIEHSRTYLRKIAKEIEFGDDLILDRRGKGLQLFLSPRQEFNLSWHALPFWL
ncbi:MAG: hypothetical protein A2W66_08560 [Deltaproteobacteria bacterium RIFCSPLOWO2_02_56_12]|nr:MAG: hypothetical protein A2W10_04950 [Deltaproteobacteria bacterium RBG_16_55_12]OGQ50297.1 MAG: hypothetical protein A2W66_08560 [Deltaproteobacteria bacterium RIFCSPLOWO2_02_56_12]